MPGATRLRGRSSRRARLGAVGEAQFVVFGVQQAVGVLGEAVVGGPAGPRGVQEPGPFRTAEQLGLAGTQRAAAEPLLAVVEVQPGAVQRGADRAVVEAAVGQVAQRVQRRDPAAFERDRRAVGELPDAARSRSRPGSRARAVRPAPGSCASAIRTVRIRVSTPCSASAWVQPSRPSSGRPSNRTNDPLPVRVVISPSSVSTASAARTVFRLTENRSRQLDLTRAAGHPAVRRPSGSPGPARPRPARASTRSGIGGSRVSRTGRR